MKTKRHGLKVDLKVHLTRPSGIEDEPAVFTRCGKRLSGLSKCVVNSVEAASCNRCINDEQRTHGR